MNTVGLHTLQVVLCVFYNMWDAGSFVCLLLLVFNQCPMEDVLLEQERGAQKFQFTFSMHIKINKIPETLFNEFIPNWVLWKKILKM